MCLSEKALMKFECILEAAGNGRKSVLQVRWLASEKDNSMQLCIDFKELKKNNTEENAYP